MVRLVLKIKRIFFTSELKVPTDEDRMRKVYVKLMLSDTYQEFQDSVLFCTPMKLRELNAKIRDVSITEINRLSKIKTDSNNYVGKIYAQYFGRQKADMYLKRSMVESLKDAASMDVSFLETLRKNGIEDLRNWFYKHKAGI